MKVQWFGTNILEVCSFIGQDIAKLFVGGKLYIPTARGISPVPVGSFIRKNSDGTFDIMNEG